MLCDCIKIVQEGLRKEYPEAKLETGFTFPDMKEALYIRFTYQPKGKKREKHQALICIYCPFCGKKVK